MQPSPFAADVALNVKKNAGGRGAAKGLNLDNLEDMVAGLRRASEPTRNSKRLRDAARYEKQRLAREKNKPKKK
jgi:hypothetical protein